MAAGRYCRVVFYGSGQSGAYSLVELILRDTPGGSNVATGGTASGSSNAIGGYPASRAFDGTTAGGDGQCYATTAVYGSSYIQYDFGVGNSYDIAEIVVYPRNDGFQGQTPELLRVMSSNDGTTWADEWVGHATAWGAGTAQTFTKPASMATARYFEIYINAFRSSTSVAIGEISLNNGGANLLLGGTASASSIYDVNYPASRAIDSGADTRPWHCGNGAAAPEWWRDDLGAGNEIALPTTLSITSRNDYSGRETDPSHWILLQSNDGTNFFYVNEWSGNRWSAQNQTVSFATAISGNPTTTTFAIESLVEEDSVPRTTSYSVEYLAEDITPMRATSFAVEFLYLDSNAGYQTSTACLLFRVKRRDGTVMRFASLDRDVTYAGETYLASAPFQASASEQVKSLSSGQLEVMGLIDNDTIDPTDLLNGLYDRAEVTVLRVDWSNPTAGAEVVSAGIIQSVSSGPTVFEAECVTPSAQLGQQVTDTYVPNCRVNLGSAKCGVNLASFTETHTVTSVASRANFTASGFGQAAGWATKGRVTFTSGANNGAARDVRLHEAGGVITLWDPFFKNIQPGDTFTISAGCDHRTATCHGKFNNIINYRGFPHVPGDDAIFRYPDAR